MTDLLTITFIMTNLSCKSDMNNIAQLIIGLIGVGNWQDIVRLILG